MAESSTQEKMQAAQNELLQNQERQKALLQQRQAEVSAMANMNQTLQQAAEVAVETAGGNQAQAQQFAQSTGAILGKYGMPIVQRSSSSTPQGGNVVINNTNNITVPPMQHQPIVVRNNEESSGGLQKFKAWLTGVFAKQSEEVSRRDREFSRQEGYLSRTSSKIMKRLEEFGSTVAETMNPKRIAAQMGSQLKTMLFLFGTYFLMANWGKILHGITEITKKLQGALDYFGITGDLAKQGKGFIADIKNLLGGKPGDSLKTIFSDIFRENVDIVTSFFKKEWEIRAMAAKQIKFPVDSLKGGMFNFIQNVGVYLGDLLSVLLTGPKGLSGSIGHSISNWGRQNSLGEGQAWANKDINHLTHFSRNTSLGDASIVSGGNTTISQDFSGDRLSNGTTASIRQGQAISAMIKDNSGKVNTSGVMSGLKRLKEAAGSKGVLVDPSFLESFVELGIPAEKLYAIASKGTPEYYKFVREEKGEADLADEGASFNRAFLERSIKNKAEDALGLGYIESVAAEAATNSFGSGHTGLNTYTAKSPLISGATAWINKQFIDQNTLRMVPESDPREGVTINGRNKWEFLRLTSDQLNELKALLVGASGNAKFSFSTSDERSMESLDKMLRYAISRRTGKSISMMAADYDSNIWENVREVERFKEEKDKEFDEKLKSTRTYQAADKMWTGTKEFISSGTKKMASYWDGFMGAGKTLVGSNRVLQNSSQEVKRRVAFCMKKLIDAGLSPGAAAGIVGNLLGEGLTTKRFDHEYPDGSGPSAGIAGFHSYYNGKKGELDNLKAYARSRNRYWGDLDVQVDYLIASGSYPSKVVNKIRVKTNGLDEKLAAEEAAYLWGHDYERFKGYNLGKDSKEYRKRIANALSVLENYSGIPIDFDATKEGIYEAELGGGGQVTKDESGNYVYTSSSSYSSSTTSTGSTTTGDTAGGSTTTTSGETSGKENKGLSINFDQSKTVSSGGLNYRGWGGFIETSTPDGQYSAPRLLTKSEFEEAQARIGANDAGGTPFSLAFQGITKTLNDIKALNYDSYTQMIAEMHGLRKTAEEGNNIAKEVGKEKEKSDQSFGSAPDFTPKEEKVVDTSSADVSTKSMKMNNSDMSKRWAFETEEEYRKKRLLGASGMSLEMYQEFSKKQNDTILNAAQKLLTSGVDLPKDVESQLRTLIDTNGSREEMSRIVSEWGRVSSYEDFMEETNKNLKAVGIDTNYNEDLAYSLIPEWGRNRYAAVKGSLSGVKTGAKGYYRKGGKGQKEYKSLTPEDIEKKNNPTGGNAASLIESRVKKLEELFTKVREGSGEEIIEANTLSNADDYDKDLVYSKNSIVGEALDFWPVCSSAEVDTPNGKGKTGSVLKNDINRIENLEEWFYEDEHYDEIRKNRMGFWEIIGRILLSSSGGAITTPFSVKKVYLDPYINSGENGVKKSLQKDLENRGFFKNGEGNIGTVWRNFSEYELNKQRGTQERNKYYTLRNSAYNRFKEIKSSSWVAFARDIRDTVKSDTSIEFSKKILDFYQFEWGRDFLDGIRNVSDSDFIALSSNQWSRAEERCKIRLFAIKFYQVSRGVPRYRQEFEAIIKLTRALKDSEKTDLERMFNTTDPEKIVEQLSDSSGKVDINKVSEYFGNLGSEAMTAIEQYNSAVEGKGGVVDPKQVEKAKSDLFKIFQDNSGSKAKAVDLYNSMSAWDLDPEEAIKMNKQFKETKFTVGGKNYYWAYNTKTGKRVVLNDEDVKKYESDLAGGKAFTGETSGSKEISDTNKQIFLEQKQATLEGGVKIDKATGKKIRKIYTYLVDENGGFRKGQPVEILEEDWKKWGDSALEFKTAEKLRRNLGLFRGAGLRIKGGDGYANSYKELYDYLVDPNNTYSGLTVGMGDKKEVLAAIDWQNAVRTEDGTMKVKTRTGREFELIPQDYQRLISESGVARESDFVMWQANAEKYKKLREIGEEGKSSVYQIREDESELELKMDDQNSLAEYGNKLTEKTNEGIGHIFSAVKTLANNIGTFLTSLNLPSEKEEGKFDPNVEREQTKSETPPKK